MPNDRDDPVSDELAALRRRIDELETSNEAARKRRRRALGEPYGLERLRSLERKTGYPRDEEEKKQ